MRVVPTSDGAAGSGAALPTRPSPDALGGVVFVALWTVLAVMGRSKLLQDPGVFWHTLTGDRILAQGFPRSDWLSFTFGGRPWIAHQWLGECLMAAVHRVAGLDGLLLAAAGALALLFGWLFARLVARGVSPLWSVLVVALTFAASSHHFHVRPHLVSICLFAWVYARLADVDARRRPLAALWPLPLVFLVWVNAHGAVVGGLATLGLFAAAWTAAWIARRSSPIGKRRDVLALAAVVLASLATVPITPYGLDTARAWFAILASPALPQAIVEHASLARTGSWQVLGVAALYVAALAGAPRTALRTATLAPLVWLVLAFDRIRHAPLFAVAAALALAELLPEVRWAGRLAARGLRVAGDPVRRAGWRLAAGGAAAVAVAICGVGAVRRADAERSAVLARLDPVRWPVALVPALRTAAREQPDGAPILNDMILGGFVAYEAPAFRVFVDDRWELYGDGFMLDYLRADRTWLDAWVGRSGVAVALVVNGSSLQRYLERDRRWTRTASSPSAALYRRDVRTAARATE